MDHWLRIGIYLTGGGLALAALDPPEGLARLGAILVVTVAMAYLDRLLMGRESRRGGTVLSPVSPGQAASQGHRFERKRRSERPASRSVFTSQDPGEAEVLLGMLRSQGMHPMLVSRTPLAESSGDIRYDVCLPEKEMTRAKPVLDFFLMQSARNPS